MNKYYIGVFSLLFSFSSLASLTMERLRNFSQLETKHKEDFIHTIQNEDTRLQSSNDDGLNTTVRTFPVPSIEFINTAYAQEDKLEPNLIEDGFLRGNPSRSNPNPCFIGGWVLTKRNGKCPRPDLKKVGPEDDYMRSFEMDNFTHLHKNKINDIGYPLSNPCKKNSKLNIVCNPLIYGYKNANKEPLCTTSSSNLKEDESCLYQSRNTISKGFYPEDRLKGISDLIEKYPQKFLDQYESMAQACLCSQDKKVVDLTKSVKTGQSYENGEPKYTEEYDKSIVRSKNEDETGILSNSNYQDKESAKEAIKDADEFSSSSECFSFLNRMSEFSSKMKSCEEKISILEVKNYQIDSFTDFFNDLNQNKEFQELEKNIFSSKHRYVEQRRKFLKSFSSDSKMKSFCSPFLSGKNYELSKRNECIKSYSEWKAVIDQDLIKSFESKIHDQSLDTNQDACKIFDQLLADKDIDLKRYGHLNYEGGKAWGKNFEIQNAISSSPLKNSANKLTLNEVSVEKNFTVKNLSPTSAKKSSGGFFGGVADFFSGLFGGMTQETANGIAGAIAYAINGDTTQNLNSPYTFSNPYQQNLNSTAQWNSTMSNQFTYSGSFGTYK